MGRKRASKALDRWRVGLGPHCWTTFAARRRTFPLYSTPSIDKNGWPRFYISCDWSGPWLFGSTWLIKWPLLHLNQHPFKKRRSNLTLDSQDGLKMGLKWENKYVEFKRTQISSLKSPFRQSNQTQLSPKKAHDEHLELACVLVLQAENMGPQLHPIQARW